jgi:hypothetical protein
VAASDSAPAPAPTAAAAAAAAEAAATLTDVVAAATAGEAPAAPEQKSAPTIQCYTPHGWVVETDVTGRVLMTPCQEQQQQARALHNRCLGARPLLLCAGWPGAGALCTGCSPADHAALIIGVLPTYATLIQRKSDWQSAAMRAPLERAPTWFGNALKLCLVCTSCASIPLRLSTHHHLCAQDRHTALLTGSEAHSIRCRSRGCAEWMCTARRFKAASLPSRRRAQSTAGGPSMQTGPCSPAPSTTLCVCCMSTAAPACCTPALVAAGRAPMPLETGEPSAGSVHRQCTPPLIMFNSFFSSVQQVLLCSI